MSRATPSGMRLRGVVKQPLRYEDEDINMRKPYQKRNGTKPAFPELLAAQVVPFQPAQRPAAFPSLPIGTSRPPSEVEDTITVTSDDEIVDVSQLVGTRAHGINTVDFAMSNNLTISNAGVDTSSYLHQRVEWSSLELAYRYRIFHALSTLRGVETAGNWLRLSVNELRAMRVAIDWRKKNPVTLTQVDDAQKTLPNCLEPELMMMYSDYLVQISNFELGSPFQLPKARQYLQQCHLPISLAGNWDIDPLGSGQLIDITPLTRRFPVGTLTESQVRELSLQARRGLRPAKAVRKRLPVKTQSAKKQQPVALVDRQEQVNQVPVVQERQPVSKPKSVPATKAPILQQIIPQKRPRKESVTLEPQNTEKAAPAPLATPADRSSGERNAGSMSLRNRGELKETPAMADLRRDSSFWRLKTGEEITSTKSAPAAPGVQGRASKIVTLQYDSRGTAYVVATPKDEEPSKAQPGSAPAALGTRFNSKPKPTVVPERQEPGVAILIEDTPPPDAMEIDDQPQKPGFKRETIHIDLPQPTATKFGEPDNFDTKLIMSTEAEPTTPPFAQELFLTPPTHAPADPPGTIVASSSEIDPRSSPLQGRGRTAESVVLPSIEEDSETYDQETQLAPDHKESVSSHSRPKTPKLELTQHTEDAGRTSPSRPRSMSPISDNEDFEEYQAFIRGERTRGPVPQVEEQVVIGTVVDMLSAHDRAGQAHASESIIPSIENTHGDVTEDVTPADGNLDGHTAPNEALDKTLLPAQAPLNSGKSTTEPRKELKIVLNVTAPDPSVSRENTFSGAPELIYDPGAEGDDSWSEDQHQPKRKKRKITTSKTKKATTASTEGSPKTKATRKLRDPASLARNKGGRFARKPTNATDSKSVELGDNATGANDQITKEAPATDTIEATSIPPIKPSLLATKDNDQSKSEVAARKSTRLASASVENDGSVNGEVTSAGTTVKAKPETKTTKKTAAKPATKATAKSATKATAKSEKEKQITTTTKKSAAKAAAKPPTAKAETKKSDAKAPTKKQQAAATKAATTTADSSKKTQKAATKKQTAAAAGPVESSKTVPKAANKKQAAKPQAAPPKQDASKKTTKKAATAPKAATSTTKKTAKSSEKPTAGTGQTRSRAASQAPTTKPATKAASAKPEPKGKQKDVEPATATNKPKAQKKDVKSATTDTTTKAKPEKKSTTVTAGHRPATRAQTPAPVIGFDGVSEAATDGQQVKSRKPWTAKDYQKTRESSRLAGLKVKE